MARTSSLKTSKASKASRASRATKASKPSPSLKLEGELLAAGHRHVAGIDEVGRGAWAGPVFVGAVVVDLWTTRLPPGIRDSKELSAAARQRAVPVIEAWCSTWSIGAASAAEIDEVGLALALSWAARRALDALGGDAPDVVLVDGPVDLLARAALGDAVREVASNARMLQERIPVVGGDRICGSIAAASILAKQARDALMVSLADDGPDYGFTTNKGYGTKAHARAVAEFGLGSHHRRSWSFAGAPP